MTGRQQELPEGADRAPFLAIHVLRHGKVTSHRGDVPLADDADEAIAVQADRLAALIGPDEHIVVLATATRRSLETAERLCARLAAGRPDMDIAVARIEPAMRNPDLYLAGHRVEMMSTGDAVAAQLPPGLMSGAEVEAHPFFNGFFNAPDRIGYWLTHTDPPGENPAAVARRVLAYCRSLADVSRSRATRIVAVTHSPVMRAVIVKAMGLADPGEPGWVEAVDLVVGRDRESFAFRDWQVPAAAGPRP